MKITINKLNGATANETAQIMAALAALNSIWSSTALQMAVINHTKMDSTIGFESTTDTNGEVWTHMQLADISIDDTVYSPSFWSRLAGNRVVGYEDAQGNVYENRTFLDGATVAFIADNLAHETMHKLGYSHDYNATAARPYSVPYGIGQIVSNLLQNYKADLDVPAAIAMHEEPKAEPVKTEATLAEAHQELNEPEAGDA